MSSDAVFNKFETDLRSICATAQAVSSSSVDLSAGFRRVDEYTPNKAHLSDDWDTLRSSYVDKVNNSQKFAQQLSTRIKGYVDLANDKLATNEEIVGELDTYLKKQRSDDSLSTISASFKLLQEQFGQLQSRVAQVTNEADQIIKDNLAKATLDLKSAEEELAKLEAEKKKRDEEEIKDADKQTSDSTGKLGGLFKKSGAKDSGAAKPDYGGLADKILDAADQVGGKTDPRIPAAKSKLEIARAAYNRAVGADQNRSRADTSGIIKMLERDTALLDQFGSQLKTLRSVNDAYIESASKWRDAESAYQDDAQAEQQLLVRNVKRNVEAMVPLWQKIAKALDVFSKTQI